MGIEETVSKRIQSLLIDADRREAPALPRGSWMPIPRHPAAVLRKEALLELAGLIFPDSGGTQLFQRTPVAVVGPAGMGKTQLVVEFCQHYAQCFAGVHWLDARPRSDIAAEVAVNGQEMNLPDLQGPVVLQTEATLEAWTDARRLVIFEDLDDPSVLSEWLPRLAGVQVLITTSVEDGLKEHGTQVFGLGVFQRSESLAVLRRIANRLRREKDAELESLAAWLGDSPAAMTLAGRFLREDSKISPRGYLDLLQSAQATLPSKLLVDRSGSLITSPALAAAFLHTFHHITEGQEDLGRLIWFICCTAAYLAPDLPIPADLLMRVARGSADNYDQFEKALALLTQFGLFNESDEGPVIHPLIANLVRLTMGENTNCIENVAETIGPFSQAVFAQRDLRESLIMQAHLEAFVPWVENARLPQASGLWNSLGYQRSLLSDLQQAIRCLERALDLNEKEFGPNDYRLSATLVNLGNVRSQTGDYQDAKNCFVRAAQISEDYKIANELFNLAGTFVDHHDLESAVTCLEHAIPIIEKAFGSEYPLFATYISKYGQVLMDLGRLEEAKQCFERVLTVQEKIYASRPNQAQLAVAFSSMGHVLKRLGDLPASKQFFERALEINENSLNFARDELQVARDSNNLGRVLRAMGDLDGARICFSRVLSINERVRGLELSEVVKALINMGLVLRDLGKHQEAKPYFEQALVVDEVVYHTKDPGVATDLHRMGIAMRASGDLAKARACFRHAAELEEQVHGPNHPNIATNMHHLGRVLQEMGDLPGAKEALERSLAIDRMKYGPNHSYVATDINDLGSLLQDMKDLVGARACFEQALAIDEQALGPDHLNVARDLNNLGSVLKAQGSLLEAQANFERAAEIFAAFHGPDHPKTKIVHQNLQSVTRKLRDRKP